jgi:hypothetical protein
MIYLKLILTFSRSLTLLTVSTNIGRMMAAMKNGSTYANFHTEQNPNGEVRGQIMGPK